MRRLLATLAVVLALPAAAGADTGYELYATNCSRCHGTAGAGSGDGPSLGNAGALAADFYLRTGYMPLAHPGAQPHRSDVAFSETQLRALSATWPRSVTAHPCHGRGPSADRSRRACALFADHCAGCHQIAAQGGYLTGAVAPSLDQATPTQIAEAVRIGPYLMPRFSPRAISNRQLDSIVAYVRYARDPADPGGWALGRLGPVPEGMVAWLIAGTALVGVCLVIGKRARR